jgi:hypothetical protein
MATNIIGTIIGEMNIGKRILLSLELPFTSPYAAIVPIGVATNMVRTATLTDVHVADIQSLNHFPSKRKNNFHTTLGTTLLVETPSTDLQKKT